MQEEIIKRLTISFPTTTLKELHKFCQETFIIMLFVRKTDKERKKKQGTFTPQKNEVSIKNFFSKCDQIHSFLRIWSH